MYGRSMWRVLGVAVPVAVIAFAGRVNVASAQDKKAEPPKGEAPKAPETKAAPAAAGKDIVDTAMGAGSFKTFSELLTVAGLTETLKGPGPFTVFAPSDEAFGKLAKGTVEDWKKPENKAKLAGVLKYHVTNGKSMNADVMKMKSAKMLSGQEVMIVVKDGKVMLGDKTTVVKSDLAASNGVIHTIDAVMMAPETKGSGH